MSHDEPCHFVDGDLAWFLCADLPSNVQLMPQGVQLVRAASVPDAEAWQLYTMVAGPFAATLHASEPLLLLCAQEQFLVLGDGGDLAPTAASPSDATALHAVRVDNGSGPLEVGAIVELRLSCAADDERCVQARSDGVLGLAPAGGLPGTRFVMQSDGAPPGSPPWANPRCIQ